MPTLLSYFSNSHPPFLLHWLYPGDPVCWSSIFWMGDVSPCNLSKTQNHSVGISPDFTLCRYWQEIHNLVRDTSQDHPSMQLHLSMRAAHISLRVDMAVLNSLYLSHWGFSCRSSQDTWFSWFACYWSLMLPFPLYTLNRSSVNNLTKRRICLLSSVFGR